MIMRRGGGGWGRRVGGGGGGGGGIGGGGGWLVRVRRRQDGVWKDEDISRAGEAGRGAAGRKGGVQAEDAGAEQVN